MKVYIIFLSLLIFSWGGMARASSDEDAGRDQELMQLLLQEEQVLKQRLTQKHGPQWRWRYMKLLMEKYKMVHKAENQKFLNSPMKLRMKHKKKWFFRRSIALYKKIKREGLLIAKKWPKYSGIAKIYYALASNTINHNDPVKTQKELPRYLKMVLKRAPSNSIMAKKILSFISRALL